MPNTRKKILSIPISIALLLILAGYFTRVQHWPFSFELNLLGLASLGTLYITRYGAKQSKTLKDTSKVLMVFSWVVVTTLGFFEFGYTPSIVYLSLILGVFWLILEIIDAVKPKERIDKVNPVL